MKIPSMNIIITIATIFVSTGIVAFFPSTKAKFYVFGVGVTIIFWIWLINYTNHCGAPNNKQFNGITLDNCEISNCDTGISTPESANIKMKNTKMKNNETAIEVRNNKSNK